LIRHFCSPLLIKTAFSTKTISFAFPLTAFLTKKNDKADFLHEQNSLVDHFSFLLIALILYRFKKSLHNNVGRFSLIACNFL